ncbi:hypothetical protein LINPERPRIM_LOCUS32820, partial [Linum perenne]
MQTPLGNQHHFPLGNRVLPQPPPFDFPISISNTTTATIIVAASNSNEIEMNIGIIVKSKQAINRSGFRKSSIQQPCNARESRERG